MDEDDNDGGYVDDEDKGIKGKMFVNQHMIKICFKETATKQLSDLREERKGSPRDNLGAKKPIKAQTSPK